MGVKLKAMGEPSGERLMLFFCPGCKEAHPYRIERSPLSAPEVPVWEFNGNMEQPTFKPSLLCDKGRPTQCHLWLTDGRIHYEGDCNHALAGQVVDCPDWNDDTCW